LIFMSLSGALRSIFVEVGLADAATDPLEKINKSADKTKETLAGVSQEAKKAGDSYRNVFLGVGAAMGVGGAFGLSYLNEGTQDLAKYQDAYAAFKTNVKGNDDLVASMRKASGDLMDEGDMLAQANKALLMGIPQDKLSQLMLTSRALARQTGEDLPTIWSSLTSGAARASPKMLEAIGIQMGAVTEAEKAWANARGISAAALTDEQKNQVFMNYILEHSNEILKKTDFSQESLNETLIKSNRSWLELRQELSEGALPVLVSVVKITNGIVETMRALPTPVKSAVGIIAVLGTGMLLLGSVTLLNAAAFMMLKKEMMEVTGTATLWAATQAMIVGEEGILAGATGLLTGAYAALAASELAVLWPLAPLLAAGYLLYDIYSKGWQDSMLGRFIGWLGKEIPFLSERFEGLIYALKVFWDWITKIPDAIAGAWTAVINHPLFKIAGAALAFTPIGMAINSVQAANAIMPVVTPTAERIIASTSSRSVTVRTGDYHVKVGDIYASNLDETQVNDIFHRATKQASRQTQQDIERDLMAGS
jgi:hypothetical protein